MQTSSSIASTNASNNQQNYATLSKKMKKIEMLLSSLKQDEQDEMMHLQNLIEKGQQVQDRAKVKINQCQELKDIIKMPANKMKTLLEERQQEYSKGLSLESRMKFNNRQQVQYMRLKTSISPDYRDRFLKTQQQHKKIPKLKTFEQLKKQNRLEQLAQMVHTSIKDMKPKQILKNSKIKQIPRKIQKQKPISNSQSRVLSRIRQNKTSQIKQTKQSKNIAFKLIVIFTIGLVFGLITYF